MNTIPFDQAVHSLSPGIRNMLQSLDERTKLQTQEIRLRAESKINLRIKGEIRTLEHLPKTTSEDISEAFESICGYSVYAHQNSIAQGYVTVTGGHRAGICGTAVVSGGQVTMLRDISAINLRIARHYPHCSAPLFDRIDFSAPSGILIAGAPMSGKTTLLRDMASMLSMGFTGRRYAVSLIDERGELAAVRNGVPQYECLRSCDILSGYPKGEAISLALRSMSPEIIICDEIGTQKEAEAVSECMNAGAKLIASIHAGNEKDILAGHTSRTLLKTGAFDYIAMLSQKPMKIEKVIKTEDIKNETCIMHTDHSRIGTDRKRLSLGYKTQERIA